MRLDGARDLARRGRLYPAVILYGVTLEERQQAALDLARTLLCNAAPDRRPCGGCRHCRRIIWPEVGAERFHPDFHVLERDLRTATSIDATKSFLRAAYATPYEARGQVFVLAEAETLRAGAADALLKVLEEPPAQSPRNFLLLAGSRLDLVPTLRSRSLSIYLGAPEGLDEETIEQTATTVAGILDGYFATSAAVLLMAAADVLASGPEWEDPRARRPWASVAAALTRCATRVESHSRRQALLACAEELLDGWQLRVRGILQGRILEGVLSRHLAGEASTGKDQPGPAGAPTAYTPTAQLR